MVVEDNFDMRNYIVGHISKDYNIIEAVNGKEGLSKVLEDIPDLIISDLMMPEMDGVQFLKEIRNNKNTSDIPFILLTARASKQDRIAGLRAKADDYLTKPFSIHEFLARTRALLRRGAENKSTVLKVADLELDQVRHKVTRKGQDIDLTSTEYALLEYFMLNAGHIITRTMISEHVWNNDFDMFSNVINVYVNYLRGKIDKNSEKKLIHTIRGVGYVMEEK